MKNWELYETEIKRIGLDNFGVVDNKIKGCGFIDCSSCYFYSGCCGIEKTEWLYEEAKITISEKEKKFLEIVETGYIARDKDGRNLCWYRYEPRKDCTNGFYKAVTNDKLYLSIIRMQNDFSFIKWDNGVWDVETLLSLNVRD